MPEPHLDPTATSESRTTTANARRRRLKHASEATPDSGSEAAQPALRRKSKTSSSSISRTARALMAGGGSSALESQLGGSYSPSLGRITEGRPAEARDMNSRRQRSRREFRGPAENERQLHDRMRATLTSPSLQSVLTSLTTNTSSSSGSNSTVTQGSYTSHSSRRSAEMSERRRRRRGQEPHERRSVEKLNVFNYLAPDQTNDAAWSSSASSSQDEEGSDDDYDRENSEASRAYTPASSVTHSSSDSPIMSRKSSQPGQWPEDDDEHDEQGDSQEHSGAESAAGSSVSDKQPSVVEETEAADDAHDEQSPDDHSPDEFPTQHQWSRRSSASNSADARVADIIQPPPPYTNDPSSLVPYTGAAPTPPPNDVAQIDVPPAAPEPPRRRSALPPKSGYDLLASTLSAATEAPLAPLYRRFTTLNHRHLLHLQDELAELETALAHIDAAIAHAARGGPQSRRAEAAFGNELTFHRSEILRAIFPRVAAYNDALASFTRAQGVGRGVAPGDLARYKDFVGRARAVDAGELAFLDEGDLLALVPCSDFTGGDTRSDVSRRLLTATGPNAATQLRAKSNVVPLQVLAGPGIATLAALLLVSAARTALARSVLVVLFSGGVCLLTAGTSFGLEVLDSRERWIACAGWVSVVALFGAVAA